MADINSTPLTTEEALDERSPLFELAHLKWQLVCDLWGGTDRMRICGDRYIPREIGERPTDHEGEMRFNARINRSTLTNFYKKTILKHTGKVFSTPIKATDYSATITTWLENIDLRNNDITEFAKNVFQDGYNKGVTYIIADYLQNPLAGELNAAEEKSLGLRPFLSHIPADRMLDIRGEYLNGKFVPVLVRFIEEVIEYPVVGFTPCLIKQVKILQPGTWEVWRFDDDNSLWVQHKSGTTNLDFIPIAAFTPNPCGFMLGTPVLEELAEKTIQYWRESSDLSNILNKVASPILHYRGENMDSQGQPQEIVVGPNALVISHNATNVLEYVEHSGQAIAANQNNLSSMRDEMTLLGLEPLQITSKTATEANLQSHDANSTLKAMALCLQDRLEEVITYMACYTGEAKLQDGMWSINGSLALNTNYGIQGGEATEAPLIDQLGKDGFLSKRRVIEELQRRNVINPDIDPEVLLKEVQDELDVVRAPVKTPTETFNQTLKSQNDPQVDPQETVNSPNDNNPVQVKGE